MFNWWRKKTGTKTVVDDKKDQPQLQPAVVAVTAKPTGPVAAKAKKPAPTRDTSGLDQEEINELRRLQFEQLGIPYKIILIAEARGISPKNIVQETEVANAKLANFGFTFHLSCLEYLESQLVYLDYQNLRRKTRETKGDALPEHSLLDIVVLREAERLIRQKSKLAENPTSGGAAQDFQTAAKELFEKMWLASQERQLRVQAVRKIRWEKKQTGNEPPHEEEISAMMDRIKAERQVTQSNRRPT